MPKINNMKYTLGSGTWVVAKVSVPMKIYSELTEEQLNDWMNKIVTTCPLYEDYKEEVSNHAQFIVEPELEPVAPF